MQFRIASGLSLLCTCPTGLLVAAPTSAETQNVLVVLIDDVGLEQLAIYSDQNGWPAGDPYEYAFTPTIDGLAAEGVRFTQARSSPICSPTRAALNSGRYAFHSGVGSIVRPDQVSANFTEFSIAPAIDEVILPERNELAGWERAWFGKWHLGLELEDAGSGDPHPGFVGWPWFSGAMRNLNQQPNPGPIQIGIDFLGPGYNHWYRVENGMRTTQTEYATVQQRVDCEQWIAQASEPWCAVLAFSACHSPYDWPPDGLHSFPDLWPLGNFVLWDHYRAMLETADHELGVLLDSLGEMRERTTVIFVADNGTPVQILQSVEKEGQALGAYAPLVQMNRFKGTVYEMGTRVPLIVTAPWIEEPGSTSSELVEIIDIHATIAHIASGAAQSDPYPTGDGVSFLGILTGESDGHRKRSLAERFTPNGRPVDEEDISRGYILDEGIHRWKLIRRAGWTDEVYDLNVDPFELNDLYGTSTISKLLDLELRRFVSGY